MFLNKSGVGEVGIFPLFSPSKQNRFLEMQNLIISSIDPYKRLYCLIKILASHTFPKSPHIALKKTTSVQKTKKEAHISLWKWKQNQILKNI